MVDLPSFDLVSVFALPVVALGLRSGSVTYAVFSAFDLVRMEPPERIHPRIYDFLYRE